MGEDEGGEGEPSYDYNAELRQVYYYGAGLSISEIKSNSYSDIFRWYLGDQTKKWDLFTHLEAFLAARIPLSAECISPASLNPYRNKIIIPVSNEEMKESFDALDKVFAFNFGK